MARVTATFAKAKTAPASPAKADKVARAKKAKKAQVQRLAKAQARLEQCRADQSPATPTATP